MSESGERVPLLRDGSATPVSEYEGSSSAKHAVGPLDIAPANRRAILLGVWCAVFLSSVNTTLVATLLPSISSDFKQANQASWLGTAFLLSTCTFTPLYGRLSNVMGRRGANQTAVFFAAVGTLASGLATNMPVLIAARFLTGIGGGGIITTSSIIISDMYSLRTRGLPQGITSVFNGVGIGLGGPVGGVLNDWLGWRWAFLLQMPFLVISFFLTSYNLHYVTPGKGTSAKDVLKRIDWGGSITLLGALGGFLIFLSTKYNDGKPWSDAGVITSLVLSAVFLLAFLLIELFFAVEPILAPFLLKQAVPVTIGASYFMVSFCNFSVMYFFPMWFQTVKLTSSSIAGLHLLPNSASMSIGSIFAGWMMHRTGKYKGMELIFGIFPFIAAILLTKMREDSGPIQLWLSIIPMGFGNAVILQTMLIALLAHLPEAHMAVGTGFGQLFRGIGQVGGVAVSSAVFQSVLDRELRQRIQAPNADEIIKQIRHSATFIARLPPDLQQAAKDSYSVGLRGVFIMAACSTLFAYVVRLPISGKSLERHPSEPDQRNDREERSLETESTTSSMA
ncbi:hypothetical protein PLICRDRAFT_263856 [Plicaturopsis crispa FD-325 SS-3]|nr:hypothetical protein PLICRDRAFT_263856 [Plicaturopsis crispa FD-325 SS-3]